MIYIKIICKPIIEVKTDLAIIPFCKDMIPLKGHIGEIDWLLCSHISSLIKGEKIFGRYKEAVLLSNKKLPADKVLLYGLGNKKNLSPSKLTHAYSSMMKTVINVKADNFCFSVLDKEIEHADYSEMVVHTFKGIFNELSNLPSGQDMTVAVAEKDKKKIDRITYIIKKTIPKKRRKYFFLK